MKIEKFVLGPVGTNCYIVRNDDTMECFIVDVAACPTEFVSHIRNSGLTVKAVLLTHGHFDHIMGLDRFLEEFPVPVYACAAEKDVLGKRAAEFIGRDAGAALYIYRSAVCERR